MSSHPSFNLVREPWIRVRRTDESLDLLSLDTVFEHMSDISSLNGETPSQNLAVFRLLIAILIRSLRAESPFDSSYEEPDMWRALYDSEDLSDIVRDYLAAHEERFDIFDPVAPFFQVADLATKKGEHSDAAVLIPDVGPRLFSTRTRDDARVLDAATAARWLVWLQGYDPSGIKSGALGDPRVKGGKGYPIGTGWCGAIGAVTLTGTTLRDSLLLSFPVSELKARNAETGLDLPPWERDLATSAPRGMDEIEPEGVVDLLTWQQRRVRFFAEDGDPNVTGVLIANGDKLARANRSEEPYSAQRFSEAQTKKAGREIRFARTLDPDLTIWRGVQSIFAEAATGTNAFVSSKKAAVPDRPAPVIAQLQSELGEVIDEVLGDTPIVLTLTGVTYGTQDSFIESEIFETVPTNLALLTAEGDDWRRVALSAVDRVLSFRGKYRWFLRQLLVSAGASPEDYPDEQTTAWLDELQIAFVNWIATLTDRDSPEAADLEWRKTFYRITERAIDQAIDDAGPRAAIGWMDDNDGSPTLHSAGRYRSWIIRQLRNVTGARLASRKDNNTRAEDDTDNEIEGDEQ